MRIRLPGKCFRNHGQHAFQIPHHIVIPEAQDTPPLCLQKIRSLLVIGKPILMLSTIQFYRQQLLDTSKINDELTHRMLAAETVAINLLASQRTPQQLLGIRHAMP